MKTPLWLRIRLWLIWKPWLNWWPFRVWRGWRRRHEKAVVSGFAGIAKRVNVEPSPAPDGTVTWKADVYVDEFGARYADGKPYEDDGA